MRRTAQHKAARRGEAMGNIIELSAAVPTTDDSLCSFVICHSELYEFSCCVPYLGMFVAVVAALAGMNNEHNYSPPENCHELFALYVPTIRIHLVLVHMLVLLEKMSVLFENFTSTGTT